MKNAKKKESVPVVLTVLDGYKLYIMSNSLSIIGYLAKNPQELFVKGLVEKIVSEVFYWLWIILEYRLIVFL